MASENGAYAKMDNKKPWYWITFPVAHGRECLQKELTLSAQHSILRKAKNKHNFAAIPCT